MDTTFRWSGASLMSAAKEVTWRRGENPHLCRKACRGKEPWDVGLLTRKRIKGANRNSRLLEPDTRRPIPYKPRPWPSFIRDRKRETLTLTLRISMEHSHRLGLENPNWERAVFTPGQVLGRVLDHAYIYIYIIHIYIERERDAYAYTYIHSHTFMDA